MDNTDKKRRLIDLIPGYQQSEKLKKVFSATADHLFQPEDVEFLHGYIGKKPSWYNSQKDFYIKEPTSSRNNYQLSPTAISKDPQSGQITHAIYYEDLINKLRFQGANVDNHSRLFSQEYYSWAPPIDLDKFVNFNNYYWLPAGPDAIELLDSTDLSNDAIGKDQFTYNGTVRYQSTNEIVTNETIKFSSGLKIKTTLDLNASFNETYFLIENVGESIRLVEIPPLSNPGWDLTPWDTASWGGDDLVTKPHVTISRGSRDNNQWSAENRWFHLEIIIQSKMTSVDRYAQQARRPIIEFDQDIELFQYGLYSRGIIDLIDTTSVDIFSVIGSSSFKIDNVPLVDGMKIMSLNRNNLESYGKILEVSGVANGFINLTIVPNSRSQSGEPVLNDRLSVRFGKFQNKNLYYNGTTWVSNGQQKTPGVFPLFSLYDVDGILLNDPSVYENSTFNGSKVFSYKIDENNTVYDSELGISVELDQFGDFIFDNNIENDVFSYSSDRKTTQYNGYKFAKIGDIYTNSWYKSPVKSRQYIINEFEITSQTTTVVIDQEVKIRDKDSLPNIFVKVVNSDQTEEILVENSDYTVNGNVISLINLPTTAERLVIRSFSENTPKKINGYYELPKNLSANPNNENISIISRSQFLQQFSEIIRNQYKFNGNAIGVNNYRDTAKNKGLGLSVLQHRAPILKLSTLNAIGINEVDRNFSQTDPILAIQYAQRSYQHFYNRFIQTLFNLERENTFYTAVTATACDPYMLSQWVATALKQINVGKTPASPWANSGPSDIPGEYCNSISSTPTYVPANATRLGITPAYVPQVYLENGNLFIQTHDGSRIAMTTADGLPLGGLLHNQQFTSRPEELTNPVAGAWLYFENMLYNSLPDSYKNVDSVPTFDIRTYLPGKWRSSSYSRQEVLDIQRPFFDKWNTTHQIEYNINSTYKSGDQFTYNYSKTVDLDGQPVPGYYAGIYRWFYDTDRPHTHPWEMLGFTQKPDWWEFEYGPAPYTSGNTALWEDLSLGQIRHGSRAGIHAEWARPGLLSCIPVNNQGELLPPYQAGCVSFIPDVFSSSEPWRFGDGSPIESVWVHSLDYSFVSAITGYLLHPAEFIEYTWDRIRTSIAYSDTSNSQWYYINTNSRRGSNQFYVHRESPISINTGLIIPNESSLNYFGSCGFQHWISEYLISQGLDVTNYFGNVIRGSTVQLSHRMAGFINSDSVRATVDSFGEIGYNSQIIPSENTSVFLYKSSIIEDAVYSGVIIEQVKDGWKIYGYDPVNQSFTIIPSNVTGPKNTTIVGKQRVSEYKNGMDYTTSISYGKLFNSRQEVFDFLVSYGRYLESTGWKFDEYNDSSNTVSNWINSGKEFLNWSQGSWENGTFIALSPSANSITFSQDFGSIQYVNSSMSGMYPVVDRTGAPITQQNIDITRDGNTIKVSTTNNQGIYGIRLSNTTYEHIIFFDNITSFNDVIYQPLYDLKQERIKIYTYRTNKWNGRLESPGHIIVQNKDRGTWTMVPNFESTSSNIKQYFDIERPKNYEEINEVTGQVVVKSTHSGSIDRADIPALAKHNIGYQSRQYLDNLLLEDTTQFEFYQGFIRQKGTKSTIDKLLRNSSIVPVSSSFEYFEEWLIRKAVYGDQSLNSYIEFILPQSKIVNEPQWIRLFSDNDSDYRGDDVLDIVKNDPLIVVPPENYQDKVFPKRKYYHVNSTTDIPTAGYVMLGETDYMVTNSTELTNLFISKQSTFTPLAVHNTVWQFITDNNSWNVWKICQPVSQISYTIPSSTTGAPTTFVTSSEHGLLEGDICIIYGISGVSSINGTYRIINVTPSTFQIPISSYEQGTGGTLLVYRSARFSTVFDRDSGEYPDGWIEGDLAYVDNGGVEEGAWAVYKYTNNAWELYRKQEYLIDSSLVYESKIFDSTSGYQFSSVNYFDPMQGKINGLADAEINFKTDYDPAKYNKGTNPTTSEVWGNSQLGTIWWDLSTVRYIDYGVGDDKYKTQNWGKIAPGTSIDVYEWIRSSIPPTDWASYVSSNTSITNGYTTFIPSGSVKNPSSPSWTEVVEYNTTSTGITYYYFWVKNSSMSSLKKDRQLTTQNISTLILTPSVESTPWYAAISDRSILLGNVQPILNGNKVVQKIKYSSQENSANSFTEWELIREGDPSSTVSTEVWNKMTSSLVGFDALSNDVPYYKIPQIKKYGNSIRPRQTWFKDRVSASKTFVDTLNSLIESRSQPIVNDSTSIGWLYYFNAAEPQPSSIGNWEYHVSDLSQRNSLVGTISIGQTVLVDAVSGTDNKWTIWKYIDADAWELVRIQSYNTANYWEYTNWYLTGYSELTPIFATVNTLSDIDLIDSAAAGSVIKVLNNGSNKWQLYVNSNSSWNLVGQQDGSIKVLSSVYNPSEINSGFDATPFDTEPFDFDSSLEFYNIITGAKNSLFSSNNSIEINTLFFAMINYVVAEQTNVDWIIKTSNIVLKGFDQALSKSSILTVDNIDSILGFVNEAKPYHTKIREFINGKSYIDSASVSIVDFDNTSNYNLNSDSLESSILKSTYQSWLDNYQLNPSLIRQINSTLVFDRISTPKLRRGWGVIWDVFGWDGSSGQNFGAIDRIDNYYEPTPGMIPKIYDQLMVGVSFRNLTLSSLGFNLQSGWDVAPWDSAIGWDPDLSSIESYLDQIIEGGALSVYDSGIGDGSNRFFDITQENINDPRKVVVWADYQLKTYGVDWSIPTFVNTVTINSGGTGYQIGDVLEVVGGQGLANPRIKVTGVVTGTITSIELIGQGSYSTVFDGPYNLQYPTNSTGYGTNATVDINWVCDQVEFATPPLESINPNVYIMYIGTTFVDSIGSDPLGTIYSGNEFIQPNLDEDHPEELYLFNADDSILIDTYSITAGGRSIVDNKVYIGDGVTTTFNLDIMPQSLDAILVYVDSISVPNDNITVNYVNNTITLLTAPTNNAVVNIVSIGGIAQGRNVIGAVEIVSMGQGYNVGDTITFAEEIGPSYGYATVETIGASSYIIHNGGSNYTIGDQLILDSGTTVLDNVTVLTVSNVDRNGSILSVNINNSGTYSVAPSLPLTWLTSKNSKGINANIEIQWGIKDISITNGGLYSRIPNMPIVQGNSSTTVGNHASFNLNFNYGISKYSYKGDGVTSSFYINTTDLITSNVMVTVNGQLVNVSLSTNSVNITPAPFNNSDIEIVALKDSNYSIIKTTQINVTNSSVTTYTLQSTSVSTKPVYISALVRIDGDLLPPANLQQIVASGDNNTWMLTFDITGSTLQVVKDQLVMVDGTDYHLTYQGSDTYIEFLTPVENGAVIELAAISSNTLYQITNNTITFKPGTINVGDKVEVTTYSQDLSYKSHIEQFMVNANRIYLLTSNVYDITTIKVWQDSKLLTNNIDYEVINTSTQELWSNSDTSNVNSVIGIKIIKNPIDVNTSMVYISYMSGLPMKPALHWRSLYYKENSLSIMKNIEYQTYVINDVYTNSEYIEIENYHAIDLISDSTTKYLYIDNELIGYNKAELAPSVSHPNRVIISNLIRNQLGTSGVPTVEYNSLFYNGDWSEKLFVANPVNSVITEVVFVNDIMQLVNVDYEIVNNPAGYPAGRYIQFVQPPSVGFRNIKIVSRITDNTINNLSHSAGSTVIKASGNVVFPNGYQWEPSVYGLQYNKTPMVKFMLDNA